MQLRERPYEFGEDWAPGPSGLLLPPPAARHRYPLPVGIDLFAGCGGFSLGMHQAGFHVVAALELDFDAAMTYAINLGAKGMRFHYDSPDREDAWAKKLEQRLRLADLNPEMYSGVRLAGDGWISHYDCDCPDDQPGGHGGIGYDGKYSEYLAEINRRPVHPYGCEHMWLADAKNVTGAEILSELGLERGEVDCVFGGPPCQGFSYSGRRNVVDPRNALVFDFMRIVCEIQPKTFAMENVPGIATMTTPQGVPVIDALAKIAADGGMGQWEAIRDMLGATSGVGAAFKGTKKLVKPKPDGADTPTQEALL